jgi:hypothetical protein
MKISESGAPILQGTGLASVRKRIEEAFATVHAAEEAEIEIIMEDESTDVPRELLVDEAEDAEVEIVEFEDVHLDTASLESLQRSAEAHVEQLPQNSVHRGWWAGDAGENASYDELIKAALEAVERGEKYL